MCAGPSELLHTDRIALSRVVLLRHVRSHIVVGRDVIPLRLFHRRTNEGLPGALFG